MNRTPNTCSIGGCSAPVRAKGMCPKHYDRVRRNGAPDPKPRPATTDRFWAKVRKTSTCWIWTSTISKSGYGRFGINSKTVAAHRFSWESLNGPVPEGLVLDHLCRVRHCVNPEHLEPVTNGENILRGIGPAAINKRKTHCKRGHVLTPRKGYPGTRECRPCIAEGGSVRSRRLAAEARQAKQLRREQQYARFVLTAQAKEVKVSGPQVVMIGGSNYRVENQEGETMLVSMLGTAYRVGKGISKPASLAKGSPIRKDGKVVRVLNIDGYVEVIPTA